MARRAAASTLAPVPWLAMLLSLLLGLSACGRGAPFPPPSAGSLDRGPGSGLRLWQDAAIFQPVRRLLAAGSEVSVEMYEFGRLDLEGALLAARARGADVRLIVDPSVAASAALLARARAAGLPARAYPLDDRRHQIDHVKLLLTDGGAVVGGMNWGARSAANHDYAFEIGSPPLLQRLRRIFEQDWAFAGGTPVPPVAGQAQPAGDGGLVAQTAPGQEIRGLLSAALGAARGRVLAEAFALTDPEVLAGLAAAHRRGADVRVLLDPGEDVNQGAYRLLRAAGVGVRWYPPPRGAKLHAKAGLFDGRLLLGSANWSQGGLSVNHELDVATSDAAATAAFAARFEADWRLAGG